MDQITEAASIYTAQELGFPGKEVIQNGLPPGDGAYSVPHFLTFNAIVRSVARAHLHTFDEAVKNSRQHALAMRNDPVLTGALHLRQRPVAQLSWHLTPQDETDPVEQEAARINTMVIEQIPRFQKMKMNLLDALWYGRAAVEIAYEWRMWKGRQILFIRDHIPINGDKIRFRWDGVPGILVYPGYPGDKTPTDFGYAHFLTPEERNQYIIHEHEPDDSDWTQPEMSGAIHGVGIRGRLYWFWWLKQQTFGLLMNYLKRFANGMTIFYYNASDPKAKEEAIAAAKQQFSATALIYPRWNSERPDTNKVERLEVGTASPSLLDRLVSNYFDDIMVRYILGQTLSHSTASTGLGSGVAKLHGATLDSIIKYDAVDLAETLQKDLVEVLYEYNSPGIPPAKFEFEIDSPNSEQLMQYAQILYEWGVPLDEEQAYRIAQWSKPKPGHGIITKLGSMQPAGLGSVPGVPVAGSPGPVNTPQSSSSSQ